jgi:hypothetical protein
MKLKLIMLAIFLVFPLADGFAKGEKKPRIDDRVDRLEALTEYLLTRDSLTSSNNASSSADCGLTVDFDFGADGIATAIARDTTPPSVPGPLTGTLRHLDGDGCDASQFVQGTSTDIIAIIRGGTSATSSTGLCYFREKVQRAADAGYGAVIIYNYGEAFNFEGQLLVSMATGDGSSFALPTVAMNARDGLDLPGLDGIPVTINGPAEFCTSSNE